MSERNIALKRWQLLARTLNRSLKQLEGEDILYEDKKFSVRRFSSFKLLNLKNVLLEGEALNSSWWLYKCLVYGKLCEALIRHVTNCFGTNELVGFNNTSNICVWPSEECLTYYLLKVSHVCSNENK